jgi:hypothetical protein
MNAKEALALTKQSIVEKIQEEILKEIKSGGVRISIELPCRDHEYLIKHFTDLGYELKYNKDSIKNFRVVFSWENA